MSVKYKLEEWIRVQEISGAVDNSISISITYDDPKIVIKYEDSYVFTCNTICIFVDEVIKEMLKDLDGMLSKLAGAVINEDLSRKQALKIIELYERLKKKNRKSLMGNSADYVVHIHDISSLRPVVN